MSVLIVATVGASLISLGWILHDVCCSTQRTDPRVIRACGRCLVCRGAFDGGAVVCGSCRTPHHRDCWDYVGTCSVFGCGSRSCLTREVTR